MKSLTQLQDLEGKWHISTSGISLFLNHPFFVCDKKTTNGVLGGSHARKAWSHGSGCSFALC